MKKEDYAARISTLHNHSPKVQEVMTKSLQARMENAPERNAANKALKEKYGGVDEVTPHTTKKISYMKTDIAKERRKLAVNAIEAANKKVEFIASKSGEEMQIKEAEYCLKALAETEFSGRKFEAPQMVVQVTESATLNIQQNLNDINRTLERSGIDIDELLRKAREKKATEAEVAP